MKSFVSAICECECVRKIFGIVEVLFEFFFEFCVNILFSVICR